MDIYTIEIIQNSYKITLCHTNWDYGTIEIIKGPLFCTLLKSSLFLNCKDEIVEWKSIKNWLNIKYFLVYTMLEYQIIVAKEASQLKLVIN